VVGLSQSALSQHLARLRRDRVVTTRRVGKTICYSLSGRETYVMLEALYRLFSAEDRPATELATGASATDGA
jgi:DNA-binding transcriptional ArsR family regulator